MTDAHSGIENSKDTKQPEFSLMCEIPKQTTKPAHKVILEHASFFILKVKVSPGVLLEHAKALEKSSTKYPINRVLRKSYSTSN